MNLSPIQPAPPNIDEPFPFRASVVLGQLRTAITELFSGIPGGVRKSYDVNKFLGVDARLSWQVFKLTGPGDPLSLAGHVPLPAAMKRLLAAAAKHQVNPDRIAGVKQAFDSFERLVQEQAGDRGIFETMTRGLSDDEASQQNDIAHRKAIFKGHRHYLATETETYIMTVINHPADTFGNVDIGNLRARLGMRRLRSDSEMVVDNAKLWNVDQSDQQQIRNTFDPEAARQYGVALIPQFCTQPLPALKFTDGPNGQRVTTLGDGVVGRQAPVDLVFGNVWRDLPFLSPDKSGKPGFGTHCHVTCPTARLIMDVLVPRAMVNQFDTNVDVHGFASGAGDVAEIQRTQPRIFFQEKIVRIAGGFGGAQIREVPQYLPMLKTFCNRMKWPTDEFEVFRYALEYPILGSLISLRFNASSP